MKKVMGWFKIKAHHENGDTFRWHLWEKALATGLLLAVLFSFTGFAASARIFPTGCSGCTYWQIPIQKPIRL